MEFFSLTVPNHREWRLPRTEVYGLYLIEALNLIVKVAALMATTLERLDIRVLLGKIFFTRS